MLRLLLLFELEVEVEVGAQSLLQLLKVLQSNPLLELRLLLKLDEQKLKSSMKTQYVSLHYHALSYI